MRTGRKWFIAAGVVCALLIALGLFYRSRVARRAEAVRATRDVLESRIAAMLSPPDANLNPGQRYLLTSYRRAVDDLDNPFYRDPSASIAVSAILSNRQHRADSMLMIEWIEPGYSVSGIYVEDSQGNRLAYAPDLFHWTDAEREWFAGTDRRDYNVLVTFDDQGKSPPDGRSASLPKVSIHTTREAALHDGLRVGLVSKYGSPELIDVFVDPSVIPSATTAPATQKKSD
jgi:hypothetical protein